MIRYTKANPRLIVKVKGKAKGGKKAMLNKLKGFLNAEEPKTIQWLVNFWNTQAEGVTYKELREAYLSGGITQKQLEKWQKEYAALMNGKLAPGWQKAMDTAAAEVKAKYPYFLYEPSLGAVKNYIAQHGAQLVTALAQEQKDALNAILQQASGYSAMTADEAARIMRPVIGLTKPQAAANIKYYDAVKTAHLKAHPNGKPETAEKKAKDAAARYAARQHRYRAQNIARTELAYAYNEGGYGATKDAQAQGYIGEMKKVWLTADDERVCPICGNIDGEMRNMDDFFSIGVMLPPAHPSCRCAVAYEELSDILTGAPTAMSTNKDPSASGLWEKPPDIDITVDANGDTHDNTPPAAAPSPPVPTEPPQTATTATLPQPSTTEQSSVLPSGAGLQASDVFNDVSTIPQSPYGVAVRSDSGMVEGLNLSARQINVGGKEYYEISGKLTEEAWAATAKNVKVRGYNSTIEFGQRDVVTEQFATSGGATLPGFKLMTADQASFEIYSDYVQKDMYAFGGYFRVRVPVTGNIAADTKAMQTAIDKAGLSALTANPTAADELLLKKSRLAWQHAPSRIGEYSNLTGAARTKKIDEILKASGIDPKRVSGLELQEVFPGYSTYVDKAALTEYKKAGLVNVWAGVPNADDVVRITQGEGFAATNSRITSGMSKRGASPGSDMKSGGSDSVFTRIGVATKSEYRGSFYGGSYRVLIDPVEMTRTDWYAYGFDNFGDAKMKSLQNKRQTPTEFIKEMSQSYRINNEIMFRRGISSKNFIGISCEDNALRNELLQKYRAEGVTEINGVPLEKFIKVTKTIGK